MKKVFMSAMITISVLATNALADGGVIVGRDGGVIVGIDGGVIVGFLKAIAAALTGGVIVG
jgi:hypothetical protein